MEKPYNKKKHLIKHFPSSCSCNFNEKQIFNAIVVHKFHFTNIFFVSDIYIYGHLKRKKNKLIKMKIHRTFFFLLYEPQCSATKIKIIKLCSLQTDDKFDGVSLQTKQARKQKFTEDI